MTDTAGKNILIVGGGLAGIAAAVALAERGQRVTLLEARHALGGRASSFEDPDAAPGASAELLDNCQHVLLGCCTNLLDLYTRLGVRDKITFDSTVHFLDGRGKRHDLWSMKGLPAPLHLGLSFSLFSALTLGERVAMSRAMLAMLRLGRRGREGLETLSFGEWLDRHKQPASLVKKFYDPVLISALNEETRRASAKYAIEVFQDAMLAHRKGHLVGLPNCPLGELYHHLPEAVDLRLNSRVDEVLIDGASPAHVTGVKLRGGEILTADAVILATNHHAVQRWVAAFPPEVLARDTRFAGLPQLESVPILGVHLWFDRPVMKEPAVALIDGPLQWLFRKDTEGRQVHGVISAARAWPQVPKETALQQFEAQVRSLFVAAREAKLLRGVIVIEKRATFAPLPGTDALRPPQTPAADGIQQLYLAGDYTKTDWPATMEGAVRSGYLAAEAVLERLLCPPTARILQRDLAVEWPAKLLGL